MILSFGSILMHFDMSSEQPSPDGGYHDAMRLASSYEAGIGGKAAMQALAAANAGAKVALVGKIGDDHYGKNILLKLRQRGVVTSGVGRNNSVSTGSCIRMHGKDADNILALGASQWVETVQIPNEILKPETILLVQTEVPINITTELLIRAKEQKTTTILNLSPSNDIPPEALEHLDYLIVPEAYKGYVADAGRYPDLTNITLLKNGDVHAHKAGQPIADIKKYQDDTLERVSLSASEDAFCGTFAAGLYTHMSFNKSLELANIARTLCAASKGHHQSLPYFDQVQDIYKKTRET